MTSGQAHRYVLDGKLLAQPRNISYQLVFYESGGLVTGYSTYAFAGVVHQARITGTMDTATGSFCFKEQDINCSLDTGQAHLMFLVNGSFRKDEDHVWFKGNTTTRFSTFGGDSHEAIVRYDNCVMVLQADTKLTRRLLGTTGKLPREVSLLSRKEVTEQPDDRSAEPLGGLTSAQPLHIDWKTRHLTLKISDDQEEDGDELSVMLNGTVLVRELLLTKKGEILDTELQPGLNILAIHAENNGALPPNTSRIILSDGQHQYAVQTFINAYKDAQIELNVTQ